MSHLLQSAVLKGQIETKLALRFPGALSPQAAQVPRLLACGVPAIDDLVGGGLPIGGITELTGVASSGQTSFAFSLLSGAATESACAYIDVNDTMDPKSAAAAGVNLNNLLWVRVANVDPTPSASPVPFASRSKRASAGEGSVVGDQCGWQHPRTETHRLDAAPGRMLVQKAEVRLAKAEGTPGYPNRKLSLASAPEEQIAYDHFNARHADESDPIRIADRCAASEARRRSQVPMQAVSADKAEKPWSRLEKAVRATDQVLQSGGFRVVVLDLASVSPEQALRIPPATWYRFRRAAQESDALFILLTQVTCARSSALCVLDCSAGDANISGNLLCGLSHEVEVARQRLSGSAFKKSPGRVASWDVKPAWMRAAGE